MSNENKQTEKEVKPNPETHDYVINFAPLNTVININYFVHKNHFYPDVTNEQVMRYFKGIYRTTEKFKKAFVDRIVNIYDEPFMPYEDAEGNVEYEKEKIKEKGLTIEFDPYFHDAKENVLAFLPLYESVKPFTYKEAFELENREFQALVFGSINVGEMIKELGHKRLKTDGKPVRHKQFDSEGNFTGYKEYDVIYELHEVNTTTLGTAEPSYAIKCWCTSTNKEHWLWIEEEYKGSVLGAVASTFRIHPNLIPYIKELKRQGDVLLVELTEDVAPEGDELVPLTEEQYFGFLTAQS